MTNDMLYLTGSIIAKNDTTQEDKFLHEELTRWNENEVFFTASARNVSKILRVISPDDYRDGIAAVSMTNLSFGRRHVSVTGPAWLADSIELSAIRYGVKTTRIKTN